MIFDHRDGCYAACYFGLTYCSPFSFVCNDQDDHRHKDDNHIHLHASAIAYKAPTSIAAPPPCAKAPRCNICKACCRIRSSLWISDVCRKSLPTWESWSTFPKDHPPHAPVAVPMHAKSNLSLLSSIIDPIVPRCPNACRWACLPKTYPLKPFAQQSGENPCNQFLRQHSSTRTKHDISYSLTNKVVSK